MPPYRLPRPGDSDEPVFDAIKAWSADGVVLPPPTVPKRDDPEGNLPMWTGIPLEPETQGAHLQPGTLFCQVGDPTKMEAILVIEQADIDYVAPGQKVDIKLVGAHFPAIWAGYIWDDREFVMENPLIQAKDGLYRFWFTKQATSEPGKMEAIMKWWNDAMNPDSETYRLMVYGLPGRQYVMDDKGRRTNRFTPPVGNCLRNYARDNRIRFGYCAR